MYVIGDAGAGDASEVHPQIEPLRCVDFPQRRLGSLNQIHHFIGNFFRGRRQLSHVRVGSDHQVAADVRIAIKDYEIKRAAAKDVILFVVCRVL